MRIQIATCVTGHHRHLFLTNRCSRPQSSIHSKKLRSTWLLICLAVRSVTRHTWSWWLLVVLVTVTYLFSNRQSAVLTDLYFVPVDIIVYIQMICSLGLTQTSSDCINILALGAAGSFGKDLSSCDESYGLPDVESERMVDETSVTQRGLSPCPARLTCGRKRYRRM